jgi:hypothetical protein
VATIDFWAQTLISQQNLTDEFRAKLLKEIGCENHKEVQHRDAKPPWCNSCGWSVGRPATSPFRGKVIE